MTEEKKQAGLFSKIASHEDALNVVKNSSNGFLAVAALQVVFSFFVGYGVLIDATLYATGGLFLRKFNSRVAAVVLLLLSAIGTGVTFANKAGANLGGGSNIFLALFLLWAGIRATEATFKLHGRFASAHPSNADTDA